MKDMIKKSVLIVMLFCCVSVLYAGSSKQDGWYKFFKGKAGEYPATLSIVRFDKSISGYVYLDKDKQPLRLIGEVKGDSLLIGAYTVSSNFANIDGVLKGGVYSGKCSMDGSNNYKIDFQFTEDPSVSAMFDFEYVKGEKKLIRAFDKSPVAAYTKGVIWPTDKYADYQYMRKVISELEKFPANMKTVESQLDMGMKESFNQYLSDFKDVTRKELEKQEYTNSYNMESEDLLVPSYFDKNLMVLSSMSYLYSGGAHGNYGTSYISYDLKNKRELKLEDIITDSGKEKLPKLLEKYFRKQFDVPDTSSLIEAGLFIDTINVNSNFSFTAGCLMFCYVPYEIGPYAMGEVSIYIPVKEIENMLMPEAKSLIK